MRMLDRINEKNDLYDEASDASNRPETKIKIAPKAKGMLGDGFTKLDMPKAKDQGNISDGPVKNFGPAWRPKGAK